VVAKEDRIYTPASVSTKSEEVMPICFKNNFIFFHIPRCSGTYFDTYYRFNEGNPLFGIKTIGNRKLTLPHLTYADVRIEGLLPLDILNSFFKFTIIRDPFPRMVSDYIWQKNHDLHGEFKHLSFMKYLDKGERIMGERKYFEKIHYDHFRPMNEYCYWNGTRVMDEILVLEDIESELLRIKERINLDRMPRMNSSSYNIDDFSTKEHIDRVYGLYAEDKNLHDALSNCSNELEHRSR
jgi:hypothetical protein